jgi:selenide, water dikinase
MSRLNKSASELAVDFGVRGGTDVTGFGLLGHAMEMADASGVSLHLILQNFPSSAARADMRRKASSPAAHSTTRITSNHL